MDNEPMSMIEMFWEGNPVDEIVRDESLTLFGSPLAEHITLNKMLKRGKKIHANQYPIVERVWSYRDHIVGVAISQEGFRVGFAVVEKFTTLEPSEIQCHGGITMIGEGVVGFDCAHWCDTWSTELAAVEFNKHAEHMPPYDYGDIKTTSFCEKECEHIVDQMINLGVYGMSNGVIPKLHLRSKSECVYVVHDEHDKRIHIAMDAQDVFDWLRDNNQMQNKDTGYVTVSLKARDYSGNVYFGVVYCNSIEYQANTLFVDHFKEMKYANSSISH